MSDIELDKYLNILETLSDLDLDIVLNEVSREIERRKNNANI